MTEATFSKEVNDACRAVRLASKLCQRVQKELGQSERVEKQDDSPVTVADYGAQAVVAWVLSRAAPHERLSMVAEEDSASLRQESGRAMLLRITELINSVITTEDAAAHLSPEEVLELIDLGDSAGGPSGRHWVLDPIDGTRGFVGMRQYSVCLGMLNDGEVKLGVLGCPNLPQGEISDDAGGEGAMGRAGDSDVGCLFLAHKGQGAYAAPLWDESAEPVRVHVASVSDFSLAKMMESVESRHSNHSVTAKVAREAGVVLPPLRMDSQVKYGLLSRGDAPRVFMRFPPPTYREKIWDHAAGVVIVEEAGGKVTDALGDPLDFSKGRYLDTMKKGIIAAPAALHGQLVKAVRAVLEREEAHHHKH
eukprot:CAMPEP_0202900884 /NCGR_PEP_ID=MMETSP1392-20130828/12088_1 /ASSEMBLY_ACC=CAM_ASM_000868 /TAXON_ID=225041 /ORGANISM="Chlamydomonas chlamydogama, Strain SAG 11-48b" /LENGTH=363 /DNA_ID=CAMNT_0049587341 /DNA_START=170 /DNA_END=1261 /DNA_ORIENTATION=-